MDLWQYQKDLLDRLLASQTDYSQLVPEPWKQEHPEAVREYRQEGSRYKADRKQVDRAHRTIKAKQKRQQTIAPDTCPCFPEER